MKNLVRLTAVLLAAACLLGSAAACNGGGGASSLEDYFLEYEQIDNTAENETADLEREYDASLSAAQLTDDVRSDLQEYFRRQIEIRQTYVDDITKLEPPDEAKPAHDASISSYQDVLTAFDAIIDDIGNAASIDDLDAIFGGEELTTAIDKANKACADLQQVADDNDINVNLECE